MTSSADRAASTGPDPFRHLAIAYHGVDEVVDMLASPLHAAVTRGDLVWVAVDDTTRGALERRLGGVASGLVFGDPGQPYSYSGQTTAARRAGQLREVLDEGRAALLVTDVVAVGGRDPVSSVPDSWSVVDASCDLALRGLPVTLICLYDAERMSEDVERSLLWNHPRMLVGATEHPNPLYRPPAEVLASIPVSPAPALGPPSEEQRFADSSALRGIRARALRHGLEAGLAPERVDGLRVAVCELVSNSIEHGGGRGTLSWWISPGRVVAQVDDQGHMSDVTPGLRRPDMRSIRGRGVWLARQLCDVVHLWTGVDGTHARLELGVSSLDE